jgi:hypothetical protein
MPKIWGVNLGKKEYKFFNPMSLLLRKEVIHPLLPEQIPCYNLILIAGLTFSQLSWPSGPPNSTDLMGGVYKTRERIHRDLADSRLLPIPRS